MTQQIFTQNNFLEMPWKNGGGVTTELFSMPGFRLSIANVHSDGPFSIFPKVDRILMLLEGTGFHLYGSTTNKTLNDYKTALYFSGEESIQCTLLNGACRDFNVMTDRSFAKSTISLSSLDKDESRSFTAECDLVFLYDKDCHRLYKLDLGDVCEIHALNATTIFVINVTLL